MSATNFVMWALAASAGAQCLPFEWQAVSFGAYTSDRAAITIPVNVEGAGERLRLQLDTGAARTHLYAPEGAALAPKRVSVAAAGWPQLTLNIAASFDAVTDASAPVGTAGVDHFPNGFVLKLQDRVLCSLDQSGWNWQPISKVNGSPVIEVKDGEHTLRLLLDTGSAAFTVLSTPALSRGMAKAVERRTLSVPSFGRQLAVKELEPRTTYAAFGQPLALAHVYAFADADIEKMLRSAGIDGLIGLSAFDGEIAFDLAGDRVAHRGRARE